MPTGYEVKQYADIGRIADATTSIAASLRVIAEAITKSETDKKTKAPGGTT